MGKVPEGGLFRVWLVQMDFSIDVASSFGVQDLYVFLVFLISFVYVCLTYFYAAFLQKGVGKVQRAMARPTGSHWVGAQLEGGDPAVTGEGPPPRASSQLCPLWLAWAVLVRGLSLPRELSYAPGSETRSEMNINHENGAEAATRGTLKINMEAI